MFTIDAAVSARLLARVKNHRSTAVNAVVACLAFGVSSSAESALHWDKPSGGGDLVRFSQRVLRAINGLVPPFVPRNADVCCHSSGTAQRHIVIRAAIQLTAVF